MECARKPQGQSKTTVFKKNLSWLKYIKKINLSFENANNKWKFRNKLIIILNITWIHLHAGAAPSHTVSPIIKVTACYSIRSTRLDVSNKFKMKTSDGQPANLDQKDIHALLYTYWLKDAQTLVLDFKSKQSC